MTQWKQRLNKTCHILLYIIKWIKGMDKTVQSHEDWSSVCGED